MEVTNGTAGNKTVTFVQVLTVADVAEAAALAVAELGQTQLGQTIDNQVMQIVTMEAPIEGTESVVTVSQEHVVCTATTDTTTTPATSTDSNSNAITSSNFPAAAAGGGGSSGGSNNGEDRICLICGDRANGVHYNVLSCEGCKSFFLRSNRSGATFNCAQGGNCNMDLYTRRHCPACRMKRCLECGMKVERVWDKNRLQTRKPLIRIKRKRRQPNAPAQPPTPSTLAPPSPSVQAPATPGITATPPQPVPTLVGASVSTTPSSSRSSSPVLEGLKTVTSPSVPVIAIPVNADPVSAVPVSAAPVSIIPAQDVAVLTSPSALPGVVQAGASLPNPDTPGTSLPNPDTPGTSTQTLITYSSTHPQLTLAQEQLMLTLEKGYNASTEVLKHLSKDVPLFRMTHWSKLKSSNCSPSSLPEEEEEGEEDEDMEEKEPKKIKLASENMDANTNSAQEPAAAATDGDRSDISSGDPLAILSSSTGQSTDIIYKLTSLATSGQITDPASALNVLAASEQGMRVIQSIGALVQGQDLNTLISLASLVGQIIGMGGGMLNDTLADTILGSITGSMLNGTLGMSSTLQPQAIQNVANASASSSSSSSESQNGNKAVQSSSQPSPQDDLTNTAAFAQLASSGLAEALAMLAAMASSSQNKETIVEMVKRVALSLLKGKEEQRMSFSSPPASLSSNFYMPTDVGEEEVKTSPFLQSLQKVTSFLTSGKMSAGKKSATKAKRTVNKEMLHIAMDMFAVLVKQTIHFAKSIPGFTNLSCDDQAVLIKSSIVDALLLRCADSYALDKDCLVNDTNGDKFDVHMMYQLGFSTLPEVVFEFMRDTKACGLTTAEYALFTAAALLSPDRSDLKDRKMVEEMQLEMILALQAATKVFHPDKPFLFTKLITKLTTLRDMSILHLSEIMAVKVQEQDLSPLIVELFGLDF